MDNCKCRKIQDSIYSCKEEINRVTPWTQRRDESLVPSEVTQLCNQFSTFLAKGFSGGNLWEVCSFCRSGNACYFPFNKPVHIYSILFCYQDFQVLIQD